MTLVGKRRRSIGGRDSSADGRLLLGSVPLLLAALSGCGPVNSTPFVDLHAAAKQMEADFAGLMDRVDAIYVQDVILDHADDAEAPGDLDALAVRSTELSESARLQKNLLDAITSYTLVLSRIASGEERKRIAEEAEALNGHLKALANDDAVKSLAKGVSTGDLEQGIDIFTTAANVAAEWYYSKRSREGLQDVMGRHQKSLELGCALIGENLKRYKRILNAAVTGVYADTVIMGWKGLDRAGKSKRMERALLLVNAQRDLEQAMSSLRKSLSLLPVAHEEAYKSIEEEVTLESAIREMEVEGRRIARIYKRMKEIE